jgi:hypothetical protein
MSYALTMSEIGNRGSITDLKYGKALSRRDAIKFGTQLALDKTIESAKTVTAATAITKGVENVTGKEHPILTDERKNKLLNTVATTTAIAAIGADALERTHERRNLLKAFFIGIAAKTLGKNTNELDK